MFKNLVKFVNKKTKILFYLSLIVIVIQALASVLQSQFLGDIINVISFDEKTQTIIIQDLNSSSSWINGFSLSNASILISMLLLTEMVFGMLGVFLASKVASNYVSELRKASFVKIQSYSIQEIDKFSTSSLVTRLTNDIQTIFIGLFFVLSFFTRGLTLFIFGIIVSSINSPTYSLTYLAIIPLILMVIAFSAKRAMPFFKKTQENLDYVNQQSRETILGIRIVKSYNLEQKQKTLFFDRITNLMNSSRKAATITGVIMPFINFLVNGSIIAVLLIAGGSIIAKNVELVSQIMSFINVLQRVLFGFIIIIVSFFQAFSTVPSFTRINEILSTKSSIVFNENSTDEIKKGDIIFENVSFSFPNSNEPVIKNINLEIKENEKIGIIGKTGSGKSTFINLLSRLIDPTQGSIKIDGINIKNFSKEELNKKISLAFQQVTLISGTIRSNIEMGLPRNTKEEERECKVIEAAKAAEAWEFIQSKNDKLESKVEQRGKNFSGGQKQRISLARTIIKKAPILILDDSTSALDNTTEAKVWKNLSSYCNSTTIVVAQRVSSLERMDKIIVLNDGEIVGFDTHKNLINTNDFYKDIVLSQIGKEEFKKEKNGK